MLPLSEYLGDYYFGIYMRHYEIMMTKPKGWNLFSSDVVEILENEFDVESIRKYKSYYLQYQEYLKKDSSKKFLSSVEDKFNYTYAKYARLIKS